MNEIEETNETINEFLKEYIAYYSDYATLWSGIKYGYADICFATAGAFDALLKNSEADTETLTLKQILPYISNSKFGIAANILGEKQCHSFSIIPYERGSIVMQSLGGLYPAHVKFFETNYLIKLLSTALTNKQSSLELFGFWVPNPTENPIYEFDPYPRKQMHVSLLPDRLESRNILNSLRREHLIDNDVTFDNFDNLKSYGGIINDDGIIEIPTASLILNFPPTSYTAIIGMFSYPQNYL
tara:strand:- start:127796 stop:128521 length:726 start_codon:yes stop_codon:yes gene_type:complete